MERIQQLTLLPLIPRGKRPLLVAWQKVAHDDPMLGRVRERVADHNVGIRLDHLVVVDCDTAERVEWWRRVGPYTPFVSRGRPERASFWYRLDPADEVRPMRGAGFEVKTGAGHQCVVPPSIHPCGARYAWLGDALGPDTWETAPALPGAILAPLVEGQRAAPLGEGGWDAVLEGEGRDNFLTAAAGFLRRRGASERAVRAGIAAWNHTFCEPRLPSTTLDRIARSAMRWGAETEYELEDVTELDRAIERYASQ
jgi:hypothetical protein